MVRMGNTKLKRLPPPTAEERARALAALDDLERLHQEMLAARGGRPFPRSVDVLRELREEQGCDQP